MTSVKQFVVKVLFVSLLLGMACSTLAQDNLEELYLRKAVKEFVGKQYDEAIADLDQVITVNRANLKARKLLAKCYERKGSQLLAQNQYNEAESVLRKALEYDPANAEATAALTQVATLRQSAQSVRSSSSSSGEQQSPQQQQYQQPQVMQQAAAPVIIQTQGGGGSDSLQTKVVTSLLKNFEKQQDMMARQLQSSNAVVNQTGDQKDQYLKALMSSMEQKNEMMKNFMIIGGAVVLGIVVIVLLIFMFVFRWFAKSSELRTLQATETINLLLAGPQGATGSQLLLGGPSGAPAAEAGGGPADSIKSVTLEALNQTDPLQRAQAVEAVAAEIIDNEQSERMEKIKKLGELLKDDNNRVRANAAKALYEIDKEASLHTLNDMLQSDSNRMRASAMWALGELGNDDAFSMIMKVDDEEDEIVNYNIKMALEKIKTRKKFPIGKEMLDKIDARLLKYADIS